MPARKSRASRIIGERAVRSMAASTSASAEASVPSTISIRTGSIMLDQQIGERVDARSLAREHNRGRTKLFDDRRPLEAVVGLEQIAPIDRRFEGALVETDGSLTCEGTFDTV